ncbi:MAG: endonuclease [Paludibacteraceae bacterium]
MKHSKYIVSHIHLSLLFAVVLLLPLPVRAITSSYYNSINGQKETALRNALYTITSAGPSGMSYDGLWTAYQTTDVYPSDSTGKAGKIWDMYSDCLFTPTGKGDGKQCGNYSGVCDCFNREHSLPKSWFKEATPAYYDLGHIVPTDGKVNGMRSNNVFGECASGYATWGTGKLGTAKPVTTTNVKGSSTITTTFTGTAFEPADKYKGDFARMYMYMVIRYKPGNSNSVNLAAAGEGSTMFNSADTNYGLTDYSIALLMKWHRQDPVSQKEIDRNNGMETTQGNRNPFIDYPCLAEYLWGNKAGQAVTLSELVGTFTGSWTSGDGCPCVGPTITSPTGTVNIGTTNTSNSIYKDVTVQGTNLESGSLTLTIGGTNGSYFKLPGGASNTTITKEQAEAGYNITITYSPTANGSHTATLTISGCGVTSHVVTLTGTCTTVYTATWMANGSTFGTSTAASGASPELPATNPSNCTSSRVFVGWTATSGYSGNSAPGDLFTTTAQTITTDKTFYAVYADKTEGVSGTATFTASDINSTPLAGTNTWTHTASGITLSLSAGQRYTSGTPNTFTVTKGTSNYAQLSGDKTITQVVATISGDNYKINSATPGSLTTSGTTQTISNINSTSVKMTATTDYQIRLTQLEVTYTSVSYDNYSTQCAASSCTLSNITLNTSSVQKSFAVGDAFNYTDLIVTANYSDCVSKTVTPTSVSSPDMSTTGDKTVTVRYTESGTTKTATYTITVETAPEYTVTFMNMGGTHATRTGTAGSAISAVSEPTACTGYTFEGWSTAQYAVDNTGTPSLSTPTTIPAGNVTYYAVYSKTEGSGSSSTSNITASASLVSGSTSGYTFATSKNGGSSNPTYNSTGSDVRLYAKNQITISASSTITQIVFNLSTQGKKRLASIEASAGTIATQNSGDNKVTWTGSATSVTFTVGDNATYGSDGESKAGQLCFTSVDITSGSGSSTTYHTTAPDCCTYTITATTDDEAKGTVSVTTP